MNSFGGPFNVEMQPQIDLPHSERSTITEGPMVAKKWKLRGHSTDVMVLERYWKYCNHNEDQDVLLVRPNIPQTMILVTVEKLVESDQLLVECNLSVARLFLNGSGHGKWRGYVFLLCNDSGFGK